MGRVRVRLSQGAELAEAHDAGAELGDQRVVEDGRRDAGDGRQLAEVDREAWTAVVHARRVLARAARAAPRGQSARRWQRSSSLAS